MNKRPTAADGRWPAAAAAAAPVQACTICGKVRGVVMELPRTTSRTSETTAEEEQAAAQALVAYQQRVHPPQSERRHHLGRHSGTRSSGGAQHSQGRRGWTPPADKLQLADGSGFKCCFAQ